jgi:hypothetical protein
VNRMPLVCLALMLVWPAGLVAQEVQVPLDRDGQIQEIDRRLAERLDLFLDEYPDLDTVRLYRIDDDRFVLEVAYTEDGQAARRRVELSGAEVAELRDRVTRALVARAPEAALDQDGRLLLVGGTTLVGLGYYGWVVPLALDVEDGRGFLASYMLTAGASFLIPYIYTRHRPVTYGMANAGFWGATRGALHGAFLAGLFDPSPSEGLWGGLSIATSLAESLAGYAWARRADLSAGDVHVIGNFGDFGTAAAGYSMLMLQPDNESVVYGSLLAGAAAGLAMGPGRARSLPYTWGDAEVQRGLALLGAGNGAAVFDWIAGDDASDDELRLLGGLLLGGSAAGLVLADRALRGRDFTAGQGILVDLGTVAGGLIGLGVAALVGPEEGDETLYFTLAALGADLGFLATYGGLSPSAERQAREATRGGSLDDLDLELNPGALLLLREGVGDRVPGRVRVPVLSVRYRF